MLNHVLFACQNESGDMLRTECLAQVARSLVTDVTCCSPALSFLGGNFVHSPRKNQLQEGRPSFKEWCKESWGKNMKTWVLVLAVPLHTVQLEQVTDPQFPYLGNENNTCSSYFVRLLNSNDCYHSQYYKHSSTVHRFITA